MYSKVEISNIVVRGVEVKKSEIRLKSENLHPTIRPTRSILERMTERPNQGEVRIKIQVFVRGY